MKKLFLFVAFSFFLFTFANAQIDRSQRPQPGPAPVIQLGDFETFTLDNGLRVIVVENSKIPVVSFQLTLDIDPVMEGEAKGYVSLGGSLLGEGTLTRTKQEIDESIDFMGANLVTFSTGMFASSLSRHKESLLDLMSDILLNPSFPEQELQRLITQQSSSLTTARSDAGTMARNVGTATAFGPHHPYGEIMTVESLSNVTTDLIRDYYNTYFRPNVAYMVIVGDISKAEAERVMKQYFAAWEPAAVPSKAYPTPLPPDGRRVAFADRTGAIQSVVSVTYPVVLTPGHPDAIKASVMNFILGGGAFSGRLLQNLREDKGYTYGAYSSLGADRLVSRFVASAEVRNSVTDSTVVEILKEMDRLIHEPVDEESLDLVKNYITGSFARSLESPRTMASFALNIALHNLPEDYYATYLERLQAVTAGDVQEMAAKYLKPKNAIIAVAGNKDEVADNLAKFSATGEVEFFDAFGQPVVVSEVAVDTDMTADKVIRNYIKAIGGREKLEAVNDLTMEMLLSVMGQQATVKTYQKKPNRLLIETIMGGTVLSRQIFDGSKMVVTSPMGKQEITEGPLLDQARLSATSFPELMHTELGMDYRLLGAETLDGRNVYRLEFTSPGGEKSYDYYCMETGLKLQTRSDQSTIVYRDYREVEGILFPFRQEQQAGPQQLEMTLVEVKINSGLSDELFNTD
jgi:zinc protease